MVSAQFWDIPKWKICSKIVPSHASFNKTEYKKEHLKRLFQANVKWRGAVSEEFMAQHQTNVPADMKGVMEIFWDPWAAQKCIKGVI